VFTYHRCCSWTCYICILDGTTNYNCIDMRRRRLCCASDISTTDEGVGRSIVVTLCIEDKLAGGNCFAHVLLVGRSA
jgi:hypothetical protein